MTRSATDIAEKTPHDTDHSPEECFAHQTIRANDRTVSILGVDVTDVTINRAVEMIESMIVHPGQVPGTVYFVNTRTLNLAASDSPYRDILNNAEIVFGDGTGVRWAARLQGVRLQDNVNGTDLVPLLLQQRLASTDRTVTGGRYFMLGGNPDTIERAAAEYQVQYPLWQQVGFHHGYLADSQVADEAIRSINASGADVLLVGMGNPIQEKWIASHRDRLNVAVCMAVGGLFDYGAGNIRRAPLWLRRRGLEWLGLLVQQPHKARRYLLGNPLFLGRILREHLLGG